MVPYWLKVHPQDLHKSDHSWWFHPLVHYDTILYVGPFVDNGFNCSIEQTIITIKTTGLSWSTDNIQSYLNENLGIGLSDISILWHVIEASSTCRITGHSELVCPLIAVIADTHHLTSPISSILPYISRSGYTHITCTHNQHAPFFEVACGIPSFSFPYTDLGIGIRSLMPSAKRKLVYYGNLVSPHHVFRSEFVNKVLTVSSIQLGGRLTFHKWLEELAHGSQHVFTCSLNGSFSFQTLMPLLFGNTIITDPICSANWLGNILPHLPECYIFKDLGECLNIIKHIEKDLHNAKAMKFQGFAAEFLRLILADDKSLERAFTPEGFDQDALPDVSTDCQKQLEKLLTIARRDLGLAEVHMMIRHYEAIQELHRMNWQLGIAPVTRNCKKSIIYDAFLRLMPTMLPRLKYPDKQGIPLQNLEPTGIANFKEDCTRTPISS